MSLILNDDEIREAKRSVSPYLADPDVLIAQAQARHMAREIVKWMKHRDLSCSHFDEWIDGTEAWLRQEGVM
jgi:hypothetical protein